MHSRIPHMDLYMPLWRSQWYSFSLTCGWKFSKASFRLSVKVSTSALTSSLNPLFFNPLHWREIKSGLFNLASWQHLSWNCFRLFFIPDVQPVLVESALGHERHLCGMSWKIQCLDRMRFNFLSGAWKIRNVLETSWFGSRELSVPKADRRMSAK